MAAKKSGCPEYLISQSTHTCLTVISGSGIDDAVVALAKCNGELKQQWYLINGQWQWGGNRSLCLSQDSASGKPCLAPCDSFSEKWTHDSENRLVLGSKALDVPWASPRTCVIFYPKHHGGNQKWWTLSQLKDCLEEDDVPGEHCLAPHILDICRKELGHASVKEAMDLGGQMKCQCQVESDFKGMRMQPVEASATAPEFLISRSTLTCLTVVCGATPDEATIKLSPFNGGINQQWVVNGGYWLWAGNQSYCLLPDWMNGIVKLGEVQISQASFWKFDNEGLLENESYVLDVPWESPRTRVIVYPRHGGENQQWWKLSECKAQLQKHPTKKLDLPRELVKMAEEVNVVSSQSGPNKCCCQGKDELDAAGRGLTTKPVEPEYLISQSTQTCLTVLSGTCPSDAVIGLAPYTSDKNQQWYVKNGIWEWGKDPSYCLAPDFGKNRLCLALKDGKNLVWTHDKASMFMNGSYSLDVPWEEPRTKVILWPKHDYINQKWWMLSKLKLCLGRKLYPFSARDGKSYKQEMARGIVNRLSPLSECLPHPRDINHYPGNVPATAPKINVSVTLRVGTVQQAKQLRMTVPEDWQATNMYVVAGDIFTVVLPNTLTKLQADQITVRVGAQRDCLDPTSPNLNNGIFKRMPVVSEEFDVNPGVNQLRSQFGGNLIFTYEGKETFNITAEVRNVVETPHYVLGKTSSTEWQKMKALNVPFSVLETSKVVMIVPTSEVWDVSDIDNLLYRYDEIMKMLENLAGFTENDPPPQGKQWLVDDVQITAGSAHAGFPAMFDHQYYKLTSPKTPHDWVVWHELGHNYQQGSYWSYAYGSETTVNLFSLYIEENLKADDRLKRENRYMPTLKAVEKGLTFEKADCWQKLVFLMEIKHAFPNFGWDMYRHLNRTVRQLSDQEAKTLKSNKQNQYDFVYKTLSVYIGVDLISHYQRWSLPLSEQVKNLVKSCGLTMAPQNLSATCQQSIFT